MSSLSGGIVTGVKWNLISTVLSQVINIGLMLFLSRLLTPADFGLFAMVAVFQGLSVILIDLGFASAIIQAENLDAEAKSTIFWLNVLFGGFLFFLLFLFSNKIALFYEEPSLSLICKWFGLGFLFSALGITNNALARKNMDFDFIAKSSIASKTLSALIALILAMNGFGVWALVFASLVNALTFSIFIMYMNKWVPSFQFDLKKILHLLRFSSEYSLVSVFNHVVQKSDEVLLGKFGAVASLGLYSTAFKLVLMPMGLLKNQMVNVLFPALSTIQRDKKRLKKITLKVIGALSIVSIPVMGGIWLAAPEATLILLTSKWEGIDTYIRFLIVALSFEMVQFPGAIMLAQGLSNQYARLMIGFRSVYFASMLVGVLTYGPEGLLWGIVFAGAISFLPMIWYTGKTVGVTVKEYTSKVVGPLLISVFSVLGALLINDSILETDSLALILGVKLLTYAIAFYLLISFFGTTMKKQYVDIYKKFLNKN